MADAQRSPYRPLLRLAPRRREEQRPRDERPIAPPSELAPDLVEVTIRLESEDGLVEARRQSRTLAQRVGFHEADRALIAAIVAELGRNILLYAPPGEIGIGVVELEGRIGLRIAALDTGPGIADIGRAMRDGYSSGGRLGIGLPGVRRLADDFEITSTSGRGTRVIVRKWRS